MALFLLLLCFFLSGFAALLYETAWTREFATVFGTSELAVSAVLAAYMAGLALGAALAARWVPRLTRPVLAYGVLELGIGLFALAVPFGIAALSKLYVALVGGRPAIPEHLGAAALAFQLGGTFAVLIPCAAMMGATLPLLARHAVRREEEIGPRIGLLYAVNTAGAIAGTLCAAFVLLPALGLRDTIHVGAALNALVFAAAVLLSRAAPPVAADVPREPATARTGARWVLAAIAISGVVSFSQEVLWFRMLGHIFGGSTPAFASMLASFLAGIALGSAAASRFAEQRRSAALGFALAQLGIGLTAWISFHFADRLPDLANAVGANAITPLPGVLVAGAALLPMTLCIGASFPFAVRLHAATAEEAAAASARVYAWNTLGSIVGAVGAGYVLLPVLGLEGTLVLCAAGNLALALASAWIEAPRRLALAALALAAGVAIALFPGRPPQRLLVNTVFQGAPAAGELAFVGVGRSATVTLMQSPFSWRIQTNGLPEAGVFHQAAPPERARETAWLGFLPLLARPDAKQMLIVGLGGAATLAAVPSTFASVDVIELEPEVVEANRRAAPRRGGDPFASPRVKLRLGDARGAMVLTDQRFDAIVSQPSHPWTSGASHLYTREFFELVREHLTPGGVFVQWIGIQFLDDELLRGMLATLLAVFPNLEVYRPLPAVLIFAGSEAPLDSIESSRRAIAAHRQELLDLGIRCPEDVAAALVLTTAEARALAGAAAPNRDDHNRLASGAHIANGAMRAIQLLLDEDPIVRLASGLDLSLLAQRLVSIDLVPRLQRLANASGPAERELARAWGALVLGRRSEAERAFERALAAGASGESVARGLRLAKRGEGEVAGEPPAARALASAWRAEAAGDWVRVRELDPELARVAPPDPLFPEIARLRARARLAEPGAAAGQSALEVLRPLLPTEASLGDFLLWARAAEKAGESELAWAAVDRISQGLTPAFAVLRRETVQLAARLPEHPQAQAVRAQLGRGPARAAGAAR
jgi:spermidine synthase